MAVKCSGLLRFTDEIKAEINLAADGTVEKAVLIDGDGVETPIGGGTSDYTTATVTFTNSLANGTVEFAAPQILTAPGHSAAMMPVIVVRASNTVTVTVVLYKGSTACRVLTPLGEGVEATATGSITGNSPNFQISGDGAITISAS